MYIKYENYKGGINNLIVVFDLEGFSGTSLKSKEQAIKNYKRKIARFKHDYQILNDYDEHENRYWYICQQDGSPLYDDDGNAIHFNSFEKASKYIKELTA